MNWSHFLVCTDLVVHIIYETYWIINFRLHTDRCHVASVANRRRCYLILDNLGCFQLLITLLVSACRIFVLLVLGFKTLEILVQVCSLIDVNVMLSVDEEVHSFQKLYEFFVLIELLYWFRLLNRKSGVRFLLGHKRKLTWLGTTVFAWLFITLVLSASAFQSSNQCVKRLVTRMLIPIIFLNFRHRRLPW